MYLEPPAKRGCCAPCVDSCHNAEHSLRDAFVETFGPDGFCIDAIALCFGCVCAVETVLSSKVLLPNTVADNIRRRCERKKSERDAAAKEGCYELTAQTGVQRLGMTIDPETKIVWEVRPRAWADKNQIQVGDRIETIQGKSAAGIGRREWAK